MRRLIAAALGATVLAGCQTVTFARTSARSAAPSGEWHHNSVFALVEVSDPVDLRQRCNTGWSRVTTEGSFLTGLVPSVLGLLVSSVTPSRTTTTADGRTFSVNPASQIVSTLWDPEFVEVSCAVGGAAE
jgi:hypothetical protein